MPPLASRAPARAARDPAHPAVTCGAATRVGKESGAASWRARIVFWPRPWRSRHGTCTLPVHMDEPARRLSLHRRERVLDTYHGWRDHLVMDVTDRKPPANVIASRAT